jgi:hypothetical protein
MLKSGLTLNRTEVRVELCTNAGLRKRLHGQIDQLADAGFPQRIIAQSAALLEKLPAVGGISSQVMGEPLLLVVPLDALSFREQLRLTRYKPPHDSRAVAEPVYSFLTLEDHEYAATSTQPYALIDVVDGMDTRGFSPADAKAYHEKNGRHSFDVEQCLALIRHCPSVFERNNLYAAGSVLRREDVSYTPDFWIYGGGVKMKRDSRERGDPRWGTPSYATAVTI